MSKIKKYKDGTYEIPQKFIDIVHLPLQTLLTLKGLKLILPNKITEQGQNEIAEFLIGLGEEGIQIAHFHKELQKHAWTYFHESTGETRDKVFTLNLARQRIEPKDSEDECCHSYDEREDQIKDFLGKLRYVAEELKRRKGPSIFDKIDKAIFNNR